MTGPQLAPKFRNLLTLLALFRRQTCDLDQLDQLRASTTRWISQHRLILNEEVHISNQLLENRTGWQTFYVNRYDSATQILYLHGGGLVFYSVCDYSSLLAYWASTTGCAVTGFAYPEAPEHSFDEIIESVADSIEKRLAELPSTSRVVLVGDSIGAYMALYVATKFHPGRFSRLVLIYPVLDTIRERASYSIYGSGYPLSAEMMRWFQSLCRQQQAPHSFDPFRLTDSERETLPELHLFSAEYDVLRDEAFDWVRYLNQHNHIVTHHHFSDLPHDFCLYAGTVPEARTAVQVIKDHLVFSAEVKQSDPYV